MKKNEFLMDLRQKLSGLSQDDLEDRLACYDEMIDDYVENGLSEEEAVARIGSSDEIVSQVMSEIPLSRIVKEKWKPRSSMTAGKIVLIILLFPFWFSLLITIFALLFSFYVCLWSFEIAFFAIDLSLMAVFFCGILAAIFYFIQGNVGAGVFFIGAGLLCLGLALLMLFVCLLVAKGIIALTKGFFLWVKSWMIGKEEQHA